MGLFSSKKKISVSSSIYNLAGAIEDRIQYLPTVINTKIIAGTAQYIGETIQNSLMNGPGMRMRSYARWARNSGYASAIGLLQGGQLSVGNDIDLAALIASIPHGPTENVVIQTADIDRADYSYWADQWMLANHPTLVASEYEIDMDELTNTIYIEFPGGPTYSFNPVGFDPSANYLYVSYNLTINNVPGTLVPGTYTPVDSEADLPSNAGYALVSITPTGMTMDLEDTEVTTVTYSDATPPTTDTVVTPHTDPYANLDTEYERITFTGSNTSGSALLSIRNVLHYFKTGVLGSNTEVTETSEDIGGGVIKTTRIETTTQFVDFDWAYRRDLQEIVVTSWSPMNVIIYKENSGNPTYDAMFTTDVDMGSFLPIIPLRQWADFITEDNNPTLYGWTTKAVKRSMDKKIEFINDQLRENESLGDIDFAYLVFGVSLNTKENAAKKYIYKFFQAVSQRGAGGDAEYFAWLTEWNAANTTQLQWAAWKEAQSNPLDPLYGTPQPPQATYPQPPLKQLSIYSYDIHFSMTVNWTGVSEITNIPGLGKPGARVGQLWWEQDSSDSFSELLTSAGIMDDRIVQSSMMTLYWQDKPDSYRALGLSGLHHTNLVYKGKGVDIDGPQALNDPEESGFIIPLHEGVMRSMSLKDSTQMSTACTYMVLNCYTVTKQKWYTSSWFKVVLIVAVIVITIVTWGSAAPAGAGILGTAAAVGSAVGLAGTAAIIAGAAINALAGMLIAQLIMRASTALFGPEVGAIVGAIASVAVLSIGTSLANGGTATAGLQSMTSAANLTKMTVAAGNGFSAAAAGKLEQLGNDIAQLEENYKSEIMNVYNAWSENLGYNNSTIDLQELTDSSRIDYIYENVDTFLTRTLWTGTDIAGITNGLIGGFTDASLTTVLP